MKGAMFRTFLSHVWLLPGYLAAVQRSLDTNGWSTASFGAVSLKQFFCLPVDVFLRCC